MELTGLSVKQQQVSTDFASVLSEVAAKAASRPAKILNGASVKVYSTTDFEKLLAELDAERKDKKQDALQSQFALALAVLTAAYEGASAAQSAALETVSSTADDVTEANAAVTEAQEALDASSVVLAAMTKELEALVEASATTTEGRAEDLEDEARLDEIAIAELKAKTAEQAKVVAADAQALADAKTEKAEAEAAFATALSALGPVGVSITIEAGISTAKMLRAAAEERTNPVGVQKANAIIEALGEFAERLAEMQEKELREEVAKITPELLYLTTAETFIAPGEFSEYEHKV